MYKKYIKNKLNYLIVKMSEINYNYLFKYIIIGDTGKKF